MFYLKVSLFRVHFVHMIDYMDDVHVTSFHIYFNVDFVKFLIFRLAKGLCESKELHKCRASADCPIQPALSIIKESITV